MSKGFRFTDEFKRDAVAQVVERGYAVSEVAERLGISTKSLYTWKAQFAKSQLCRVLTVASLISSSIGLEPMAASDDRRSRSQRGPCRPGSGPTSCDKRSTGPRGRPIRP